jgi:hypothetical protein
MSEVAKMDLEQMVRTGAGITGSLITMYFREGDEVRSADRFSVGVWLKLRDMVGAEVAGDLMTPIELDVVVACYK